MVQCVSKLSSSPHRQDSKRGCRPHVPCLFPPPPHTRSHYLLVSVSPFVPLLRFRCSYVLFAVIFMFSPNPPPLAIGFVATGVPLQRSSSSSDPEPEPAVARCCLIIRAQYCHHSRAASYLVLSPARGVVGLGFLPVSVFVSLFVCLLCLFAVPRARYDAVHLGRVGRTGRSPTPSRCCVSAAVSVCCYHLPRLELSSPLPLPPAPPPQPRRLSAAGFVYVRQTTALPRCRCRTRRGRPAVSFVYCFCVRRRTTLFEAPHKHWGCGVTRCRRRLVSLSFR